MPGMLLDMAQLDATGAAGIGLFRTEIQLLARNAFPDIAEQTAFYRRAYEQAGERPIVFRTLDIGGDKVLPYLPKTAEDNPAMGWRAIRIGLDRPAMLRRQLRALLRAAAGRELRVKFPMISEVAEFEAARHLLDRERARIAAEGGEGPRSVSLGVMLEVPALLWQLPALLQRVDFLSIGTNDLAQFVFACDRGNPLLAERYDLLSPPMLALLAPFGPGVRRRRQAAQHLRRDGGQPDRGDGADRARLSQAVDGPDRDRAGQDDDPQPRRRRARTLSRRNRRPSRPLAAPLVRSLCARPRRCVVSAREDREGLRRQIAPIGRTPRFLLKSPRGRPEERAHVSLFQRITTPFGEPGDGDSDRRTMHNAAGELLRERRHQLRLDLDTVAEALCIKPVYLAAIEQGRTEELPGPTYTIGFIRAYATYLGLDGERVLEMLSRGKGGRRRPARI